MTRPGFALLLAASMALHGPASAAPPADAAAMRAFAASIPDQPYYPAGYRDLRIAAAAQVAAFPRERKVMLFAFPGQRPYYDLIDCNSDSIDPEGLDPRAIQYSALALDVARMTSELRLLGYKQAIWEQPLRDFERASLAAIQAAAPDEEIDSWGPTSPLYRLGERMEKARARLDPGKAEIKVEGGCGAGEAAFVVRTAPAGGRVWVVNAFAYHVCALRVPDPWNLQACRWTELDRANPTMASGRYMYQARWPDGSTSRGARLFEGTSDEVETITIRK